MRKGLKRTFLVVCVMASLVALSGAPSASALMPWWHLTSGAAPTVLPSGGKGSVYITAANVGDEYVNVSGTAPYSFVDKLPAGLRATSMEYSVSHGPREEPCEVATLTCNLTYSLPPAQTVIIRIGVEVAGATSGELNGVSVTGGEAPSKSIERPIQVGTSPTKFGLETYEFTPEEEGGGPATQAGVHPFQLTTTIALNQKAKVPGIEKTETPEPVELPKDLHFKWPPGLIGNPTVLPQCTLAQFLDFVGEERCPPQTVVGVAMVTIQEEARGLGVITMPAALVNLEPSTGEPARFGFQIAHVPVYIDISIRTGGDYGITVHVENISQVTAFLSSVVTVWGVPGDHRHDLQRGRPCLSHESCVPLQERAPVPFLMQPTSCTGPLQSSGEADSWSHPGEYVPFSLTEPMPTQDGCNRLPFSPTLTVVPDGQQGSKPTGLSVQVRIPQEQSLNPKGLAEADVRDTTVTLPEGVTLDPSGAEGLESCTEPEIGYLLGESNPPGELHFTSGLPAPKEAPPEPFCPDASKIGTVKSKLSILKNPLVGAMYLAAQTANPFGSLVAMYLVAEDPESGVLVKLPGEVSLNQTTGRFTTTFLNTPQAPAEDIELHFFGGERAPLATPAHCGTYTTTTSIASWSGNEAVHPSSSFEVTSGPNGSPCADPLPFAPTLTAGTTSIQAGGFSPFTMTMGREDGNQTLAGIQLHMPLGLSGTLSTVKLCGEAQADAGTCGPESQIGETIISVGEGSFPYSVTGGKVYITGPYKGAPFGLSIVNPAKAGPFDLGKVVVRGKIEVDPVTAALTITIDNEGPYKIPTILDGIPLEIKHLNVNINRPNFTFNPTNCSPLAITGNLHSTEGSTDALAVPFQVTNCAVLAFKPKLTASTSGKTSRANGASLTVKLGYPAGPYDANIARVKVELPKKLPSRLTTLQKACTAAVFEANPANCPAASVIGHATATTPVLPVPLSGPAIFVSHGNESFPSLIVVLQGYGVTVHLVGSTFISKQGITSSTFKTVPDVPVGSFELSLPEGPYSALAANGDLCKAKLTMPTEFVGQNGALIQTTTKIQATGCPKAKHAVHKRKNNTRKKRRSAGGKGRRGAAKHGKKRG
jgi:hypothetical protein